MNAVLRRHAATIAATSVMLISAIFMALVLSGAVPMTTVRVLVIPAYMPMLMSAILSIALDISNSVFLWLTCSVMLLLPFAGIDAVRARSRESRA